MNININGITKERVKELLSETGESDPKNAEAIYKIIHENNIAIGKQLPDLVAKILSKTKKI
ncbi:MAG: hypothetical protein Q8942_07580 [Bacillota bacterium]|nr:hypothetical protein [Bacillota bacterium]